MLANQIKTASDLKAFVESHNPDSKFFTRETMKFFGDTMRNYGVRRVHCTDYTGATINAYALYRRRPVKEGNQRVSYFCASTFRTVHPDAQSVREGWAV